MASHKTPLLVINAFIVTFSSPYRLFPFGSGDRMLDRVSCTHENGRTALAQLYLLFLFWLISSEVLLAQDHPRFDQLQLLLSNGTAFDETVFCMIDTGSSMTVLDLPFAKSHRALIPAQDQKGFHVRIGGKLRHLATTRPVSLSFGGRAPRDVEAVCIDLSGFKEVASVDFNMVIGLDLLEHECVGFECGRPFVEKQIPKSFINAVAFPMKRSDSNCPELDVKLPVLGNVNCLADTGSTWFLELPENIAAVLIRSGNAISIPAVGTTTFSHEMAVDRIIVRSISFGGVTFCSVPAIVSKDRTPIVGTPFLSRFNIAFDFPNEQVWLADSPDAELTEFPMNASGMGVLFASESTLRVVAVRPESGADLAKIEAGDMVIELDGHAPKDCSMFDVQTILSQNGKTLPVTVLRDGKKLRKHVTLTRTFAYPPLWKPQTHDYEGFLEAIESNGPLDHLD